MAQPVALALTRSKESTFPVLQLDGRTIGGSTAVIAALELQVGRRDVPAHRRPAPAATTAA